MANESPDRAAPLQWVVVLVVGVLVVGVVLGLKLIPRLSDGQRVLDGAGPAFVPNRVAADRAGIDVISRLVDLSKPIVTPQGGGAAEVPALIAYTAKTAHVSGAQALALLRKKFPHTTALLGAIPLSSVSAEIPGLVAFLAKTLHLSPALVVAALNTNFPRLSQAIKNLPAVTGGWNNIPGIGGLTRFDGTPVHSVPQVRTYFSADVIPVLETQGSNFASLDGTSSVDWVAPLLLIVGVVVILFAAAMIFRSRKGVPRKEALGTAAVVPVVGVVLVALVLVLALIPRTSNGQKLLNGLKPVNTEQRVRGDRVGVNMVSTIVNTVDPLMTPRGGAAAEVPKLLTFLSQKTGLPRTAVLALIQENFPHTASLLQAIPISAVTAELPGVVQTLGPGVVNAIPNLTATVIAAPYVTGGWNDVPGTAGATRFDGSRIKTVPQVRDYLSGDVVPVLETQRGHYENLISTSNIDFIGPLVLIVGIIVIVFGGLMVLLAWRREPQARSCPGPVPNDASHGLPAGLPAQS